MEFLRGLADWKGLNVIGTIFIWYVFIKLLMIGSPGFRKMLGRLFRSKRF